MGLTLEKIKNINTLSTKENSQVIIIIAKGNLINSRIAYLKGIYYFAIYLENMDPFDARQKDEIIISDISLVKDNISLSC